MPPADIDAMLQHVSSQMVRSQLFRRLSANSNNSSPSRRGSRVAKVHSNSATPNGIYRRRTTAAHPSRTRPATTQPSDPLLSIPQTAATHLNRSRRNASSSSATRPMTWHPGSYPLAFCQEELSYAEVVDVPIPMTRHQPGYTAFSDGVLQSSFDPVPASTSPYPSLSTDDFSQPGSQEYNVYPSSYYEHSIPLAHQDTSASYGYIKSSADFSTTDSSQMPYDYPIYSAQQTPDSFHVQHQSYRPQYIQSSAPPRVTKQSSKELVGMGLYDGPSRRELSSLNVSPDHIGRLLAEPQGKGLKLEETWQPPKEDGKDVDEDGFSTDEGEEELPPAPAPKEAQPTFMPAAYSDLSNQSFFFDSDDPFTDYLSFDPDTQMCQPKVPNAASQNFMWL